MSLPYEFLSFADESFSRENPDFALKPRKSERFASEITDHVTPREDDDDDDEDEEEEVKTKTKMMTTEKPMMKTITRT